MPRVITIDPGKSKCGLVIADISEKKVSISIQARFEFKRFKKKFYKKKYFIFYSKAFFLLH